MSAAEKHMDGDGITGTGNHLGERLHALAEKELGPAEEAAARAHLAACGGCTTEFARLERTMTTLRGMGRSAAPAGFAAKVFKRVRAGQRRAHPLASDYKVPYEGGIVILLAAAAAVALIGWMTVAQGRLFAQNAKTDVPAVAPR